jgi:hypothetical protein
VHGFFWDTHGASAEGEAYLTSVFPEAVGFELSSILQLDAIRRRLRQRRREPDAYHQDEDRQGIAGHTP